MRKKKKKEQAFRNCGAIYIYIIKQKSNIHSIRVPKGEDKEDEAEKVLKEIMNNGWKLYKFGKRPSLKPTDSRSWENCKQDPQIHTKAHHCQTSEI